MQESTTLRTNRVAAIRTTLGGTGSVKLFSGAKPANCAASNPSGLLVTIALPATPLSESGGVATLSGTWSALASATGFARTYRIYDSTGTPVCTLQGYVSEAYANSFAYSVGQQISNVNGVYVCTTAGTSSGSGAGPSGTGSGITDGTAVFDFVAAASELVLATTNIISGDLTTISTFQVTAGNA